MKARLIKRATLPDQGEVTTNNGNSNGRKKKRAFNPVKGLDLENRLRATLEYWMGKIRKPEEHSQEDYLEACNEALKCIRSIRALWHRQSAAEKKASRERFKVLFVEAVKAVRPKKDCKLPKATGYGLRVEQKDNDPKRGRGPTETKAKIKTEWPDHSNGPATETPHKGDGRYNGAIGKNFRTRYARNGRGNGNGKG